MLRYRVYVRSSAAMFLTSQYRVYGISFMSEGFSFVIILMTSFKMFGEISRNLVALRVLKDIFFMINLSIPPPSWSQYENF